MYWNIHGRIFRGGRNEIQVNQFTRDRSIGEVLDAYQHHPREASKVPVGNVVTGYDVREMVRLYSGIYHLPM